MESQGSRDTIPLDRQCFSIDLVIEEGGWIAQVHCPKDSLGRFDPQLPARRPVLIYTLDRSRGIAAGGGRRGRWAVSVQILAVIACGEVKW